MVYHIRTRLNQKCIATVQNHVVAHDVRKRYEKKKMMYVELFTQNTVFMSILFSISGFYILIFSGVICIFTKLADLIDWHLLKLKKAFLLWRSLVSWSAHISSSNSRFDRCFKISCRRDRISKWLVIQPHNPTEKHQSEQI